MTLICCAHSVVSNAATPWTVACQDPLPKEFSSQEYWSQSPFPTRGALSNQGIKPKSLASPVLGGRFFFFFKPLVPLGKPLFI